MKEQIEAIDKLRSVVGNVPKPILHALEGRRAEVRIAHARPIEYRVAQEEDQNGKVTELWAPVDNVLHVRSTLREWQEHPGEAATLRFGSHGGLTTVEITTEDGWYKGEARCSVEDAFDRRTGRTLALERALERLDAIQEAIRENRKARSTAIALAAHRRPDARASGMDPKVSWDREEPLPEIPQGATAEPSKPLWVQIEGLSTDEFPGDLSLIAGAELVINGDGVVLKDRFGPNDRIATEEELAQARLLPGLCESRRGGILDHVSRVPPADESWQRLREFVRRIRGR